MRGNGQSKPIDWWPSELRARTAQAKKKNTSLRGQPGHIVRLATLTSLCSRFLCSPLSPPSFFSIYFLPLLPPFSSASPLLRPYCLSRCLPQVARPNVAAPFVAIAQSGRLPPCRAPLAWCHLWSSAIIERCSCVPPTILVPPMLMDAVDHLIHFCLLALSSPLQVAFLPSLFSWSSLLLSFVLVCILFSSISQKRWARWDQPVAYCPARPPALVNSLTTHLLQHTSATTFVFHLLPNFTSW